MITIETTATVASDGTMTIQLPSTVVPGNHKVVLVLDAPQQSKQPTTENDAAWDQFERIIDECAVDTGISDLAHQHDHYVHGTPRREG